MYCPKCNQSTGVVDSRKKTEKVYRRRKCLHCGYVFSTMEVLVRVEVSTQKLAEKLSKRAAEHHSVSKTTREKRNRLAEKRMFDESVGELDSWELGEVM